MLQSERYDSNSFISGSLGMLSQSFGLNDVFEKDVDTNDTKDFSAKGRRRRFISQASERLSRVQLSPSKRRSSDQDVSPKCTEEPNGVDHDKFIPKVTTSTEDLSTMRQPQPSGDDSRPSLGRVFQSSGMVTLTELELTNLKDLVTLHMDLMKQQEEIIKEKDKLIGNLRAETSMLQTRLERIDRRLSVVKSTRTKTSCEKASPSIPEESTASKHTSTASDIKLTTPHRPAKSSESSSQYRPAKPPESTGRSLKRKRTSCQSVQDGLVQDGLLRTVDLYYTNQVHEFEELEEQPVTNSELLRSIEVPSYRIISYSSVQSADGTEDLDDDVFSKRHQRHENEERRRQRWDLQRQKRAQILEKLKQSQTARRTQSHKEGVLESVFPRAEQVHSLEIHDSLPINVFGQPIPDMHSTEFSLPWYKPAALPGAPKPRKRRRRRNLRY